MAVVLNVKRVSLNIAIQNKLIRERLYKGMFVAVAKLAVTMDTKTPLVPEDTKFMRDSWDMQGLHVGSKIEVGGGYTAEYAPTVHENVGAIVWTRPGSGPKWLQIHFEKERDNMIETIREHTRISK